MIANRLEMYIEQNDGYLLLLDDSSRPKREKASQLLLYGMIKHYCAEINCTFAIKEVGKGIINFQFSPTMEREALMEIKYIKNSGMKKTLETFLSKAKNGDQIIPGYYFLVGFKQSDLQKGYDLEEEILSLAGEYNFEIKYKVLDASLDIFRKL
jgi:hypothetical protein